MKTKFGQGMKAMRKRNGDLGLFRVRLARVSEAARDTGDMDGIDQLIQSLLDAGRGCTVQVPDDKAPGGVRVYTVPPDTRAAQILIDQGFGRAKESITIEDKDAKLKGVPQVILVPPKWYILKHGKKEK